MKSHILVIRGITMWQKFSWQTRKCNLVNQPLMNLALRQNPGIKKKKKLEHIVSDRLEPAYSLLSTFASVLFLQPHLCFLFLLFLKIIISDTNSLNIIFIHYKKKQEALASIKGSIIPNPQLPTDFVTQSSQTSVSSSLQRGSGPIQWQNFSILPS